MDSDSDVFPECLTMLLFHKTVFLGESYVQVKNATLYTGRISAAESIYTHRLFAVGELTMIVGITKP